MVYVNCNECLQQTLVLMLAGGRGGAFFLGLLIIKFFFLIFNEDNHCPGTANFLTFTIMSKLQGHLEK